MTSIITYIILAQGPEEWHLTPIWWMPLWIQHLNVGNVMISPLLSRKLFLYSIFLCFLPWISITWEIFFECDIFITPPNAGREEKMCRFSCCKPSPPWFCSTVCVSQLMLLNACRLGFQGVAFCIVHHKLWR